MQNEITNDEEAMLGNYLLVRAGRDCVRIEKTLRPLQQAAANDGMLDPELFERAVRQMNPNG